MRVRRAVAFLLLGLGAGGCAGTRGPPHYLQPAEVAQREAHGGWITLFLSRSTVDGELIAVSAESVFVLMPTGLRVVPRDSVDRAILGSFDVQWGGLASWTVLGMLATASHGWYAGLTAPLWIVAGSIATGAASRAPLHKVNGGDRPGVVAARWVALSAYARFPAGMPERLDRSTLRSRYTGKQRR